MVGKASLGRIRHHTAGAGACRSSRTPGPAHCPSSQSEMQDWLAGMLQKAGTRRSATKARELQLLVEGAGVMMLISGDGSYADTAATLAKRLLSA